MNRIADSAELQAFCARLTKADFITVDTEFLRDSTYWPKLCLLQIAGPEEADVAAIRSEEHTSELQSLMRISYAVFCLKKKTKHTTKRSSTNTIHKQNTANAQYIHRL